MQVTTRYVKPERLTSASNKAVGALTRLGISVYGARMLYVRGRKTGQWRGTPVNVLSHAGQRYLVAPRGHTQWVRNLRAAGAGELRLGRHSERFTPIELADADKPAVLRAYLQRWKFEMGSLFGDVGPGATDAQLLHIAADYPVFRIASAPPE